MSNILPTVNVSASDLSGGSMGGIFEAISGPLISGAFNALSAHQDRKFQRSMSNTAYRRAANDLQKAGLNRIIAMGDPASTPPGSSFSVPPIDFVAGSAMDVKRKTADYERELLTSQTESVQQSTKTAEADEQLKRDQSAQSLAAAKRDKAQTDLLHEEARMRRWEADFANTYGLSPAMTGSAAGSATGLFTKAFDFLDSKYGSGKGGRRK